MYEKGFWGKYGKCGRTILNSYNIYNKSENWNWMKNFSIFHIKMWFFQDILPLKKLLQINKINMKLQWKSWLSLFVGFCNFVCYNLMIFMVFCSKAPRSLSKNEMPESCFLQVQFMVLFKFNKKCQFCRETFLTNFCYFFLWG